jgi:hypothetical protein
MTNVEKIIQQHDEAMTTLMRMLPSALHNFFVSCKNEGFTDKEALILTIEFLRVQYRIAGS